MSTPSVASAAPRALNRSPFIYRAVAPFILGKAKRRWRQLNAILTDVKAPQEAHLREFCRHAAGTEFGQQHKLGEVRTFEDYAARVPLGDYDSHIPYFERMRKGETNLLIPEFVLYWGNSSGSSQAGRQKFLPVSLRQIHWQRLSAQDVLLRFLANHNCRTYTHGFTLGLFPPTKMRQDGPTLVSSNPAIMTALLPWFVEPMYLPKREIREIENYEEKLGKIADAYLDYDVRAVSGTTCWFSILFDKLLQAAQRRGRNVKTVGEIWPNLTVLLGGGVSATPYIQVIRDRVGFDVPLADSYNATEGGIYAVSDGPSDQGLLMLPDRGVFFEFVPAEEVGKPNASRVPLWKVEPNRPYSIIVTTPSGLYSYQVGDTVQFTSVKPHRIQFCGRLQGNLSTTQELTTHIEIETAVQTAMTQHNCSSIDYCAGAEIGVNGTGKSRYLYFIEFLKAPSDLAAFAESVDAKLREQNRVYREHRVNEVGILAPRVFALPSGSVQRFMKEIGNVSVQQKFPRVVDDRRRDILLSYVK